MSHWNTMKGWMKNIKRFKSFSYLPKIWIDGCVALRRHPIKFSFTKAFQLNAMRLVCFFASHRFTKASFRHRFETKKPVTFVTGFAERKGFEPPIRCRIHAFQACSLNHSDTSL